MLQFPFLCVTLTESSLYIGVGFQGTGSRAPLIQCKRLPQMDRMIRLHRRPGRIWNRHPAPDVKTAGGCFNGGGKSSGLTLMGKLVYWSFWKRFKRCRTVCSILKKTINVPILLFIETEFR